MEASGGLWEILHKRYADWPIYSRTRSKETTYATSKVARFIGKESGSDQRLGWFALSIFGEAVDGDRGEACFKRIR